MVLSRNQHAALLEKFRDYMNPGSTASLAQLLDTVQDTIPAHQEEDRVIWRSYADAIEEVWLQRKDDIIVEFPEVFT